MTTGTGGTTGFTGMSGLKTGSRTAPRTTGRVPTRGSGYGKITQFWGNLTPKQKMLIGVVAGALILMVLVFQFYSKATAFVPLYPQKLTPADVREISLKMDEMKLPYSIEPGGGNILIAQSLRARVQIELAQYGLPRRQVLTSYSPKDEGFKVQTEAQIADDQRIRLEGDLTEAIRQVAGVADAIVKLVLTGDASYSFSENQSQATAAIMLRMEPGAKLANPQVQGIVHLVAYSVKGLNPGNVKVVDQNGLELTKPGMVEGEAGAGLSVQQQEKQLGYEKHLEQKVQEMLDQVLGPGKAVVKVSAEMDFSQSEFSSEIVEPGVTVIKGYEEEGFKQNNKKDEEGTQMGGSAKLQGKKGADYGRKVVQEKMQPTVHKKRTVTTPGSIKKLSVGVFVDNLKPEQVASINDVVKEAVGIDSGRGDSITVKSMPFNYRSLYNDMLSEMNQRGAAPPPLARATSQPWMPYAMMIPMLMLLGVLSIFLLKQRKVATDQARMAFAPGPTATATDISDLLTDKSGKATMPYTTQYNTTEELEKLARERPTKVAELLKSTWLAEKER